MKAEVLIERGKDGLFWLRTNINDSLIVASGETLASAKSDFAEAFELATETPIDTAEITYKHDTASALEELSFINMAALAKIVGINASLMSQYKKGQYISSAQASKIEAGIHQLGQRMVAFSFA